jgi:hypothetical protein
LWITRPTRIAAKVVMMETHILLSPSALSGGWKKHGHVLSYHDEYSNCCIPAEVVSDINDISEAVLIGPMPKPP